MQTVEAEGPTIDEAIANALASLQVERERVDIEILSDSSRGLFGLGGKPARVRATVRTSLWDAAQEGRAEARGEEREASVAGPEEAVGENEGEPEDAGNELPGREETTAEDEGGQGEDTVREAAAERVVTQGESDSVSNEAAEKGAEFLRTILELMGIEATVNVELGAEPYNDVVLQVTGEASGVVIGRHGQTVDAIEYIVNRLVARVFQGEGHIVVDAAGYRLRRRQSLTEMARRLADKAKRERRTVTLNPLSPRDRRVVHIALRGERGITTRSHGAGLHRKLLIIPGGQNRRAQGGAGRER
jgi:spoIIIJ-associated protein